jgi:hypothetical protein
MTVPLSAVRIHAVALPAMVTCSRGKRAWLLIHGAGAALAFQAMAHGDARWFALNRKVKLPAASSWLLESFLRIVRCSYDLKYSYSSTPDVKPPL